MSESVNESVSESMSESVNLWSIEVLTHLKIHSIMLKALMKWTK